MAALGVLPLAGSLKQSAALPQRNRLQNRPHIQPPRCNCVVAAAATAGPSAQQKIRVKLSSYHSELLTESVDLIRTATESTGARMTGPVPLPTRRRIYTVLRSPHVNKDSREQFERRSHFRLMDLKDLSSQTVEKLMSLDLPAGVDIDVKLM